MSPRSRSARPSVPPVRCAVLGAPVAHSLSPALHRAAYGALGLEQWTYSAIRVPAGGCRGLVTGLGPDWLGLSVTAPLKTEALELADTATERARLTGSANTLVRREGRWHADNTDLPGAAAAIREHWPQEAGPLTRACVVGAGSTAISTGWALADLGTREITLLARTPERGEENAALLRAHPAAPQVRVVELREDVAPDPVEAEVVVSTVPAVAQTPGLVAATAAVPLVFDVLYHPWPTPLAAAAQDSGRVLVSGLDLLVHQAVLQVREFTGQDAPLERMRAAGQAVLDARTAEGEEDPRDHDPSEEG